MSLFISFSLSDTTPQGHHPAHLPNMGDPQTKYATLRDVVLEKGERVKLRIEVLEQRAKLALVQADTNNGDMLQLIQETAYGVDEELRDLMAFIPSDEGDEVFELLAPTSDVHRLQQQVSVMRQRVVNLQLALDRKETANKAIRGRLDRRVKLIEHIRSTLYSEVCLLREDLKARTGCKENADVGLFSLFDLSTLYDDDDNEEDEPAQANATTDFKRHLEDLLHKWKHEESQRLDVEKKYVEVTEQLDQSKRKCEVLEENMKDLAARFSEEFINMKTEKLTSQLVIKKASANMSALEEKHAALEADTAELKEKYTESLRRCDFLDAEIVTLNTEIEAMTTKAREDLAGERSKASVQIRQLERSLHEKKEEIKKLMDQIDQASRIARPRAPPEPDVPPVAPPPAKHTSVVYTTDPSLVAEYESLKEECAEKAAELEDWRSECMIVTSERDKLEQEKVGLVIELDELRQQCKKKGDASPASSTNNAASLRECKRDRKLLSRKVLLMCEKYDAMLKAFEVEDAFVSACNEDSDTAGEMPKTKGLLPMGKPTEPTTDTEEQNIDQVCTALDTIDRNLRAKLSKDRHAMKAVFGVRKRLTNTNKAVSTAFEARFENIKEGVGEVDYTLLLRIADGDADSVELYRKKALDAASALTQISHLRESYCARLREMGKEKEADATDFESFAKLDSQDLFGAPPADEEAKVASDSESLCSEQAPFVKKLSNASTGSKGKEKTGKTLKKEPSSTYGRRGSSGNLLATNAKRRSSFNTRGTDAKEKEKERKKRESTIPESSASSSTAPSSVGTVPSRTEPMKPLPTTAVPTLPAMSAAAANVPSDDMSLTSSSTPQRLGDGQTTVPSQGVPTDVASLPCSPLSSQAAANVLNAVNTEFDGSRDDILGECSPGPQGQAPQGQVVVYGARPGGEGEVRVNGALAHHTGANQVPPAVPVQVQHSTQMVGLHGVGSVPPMQGGGQMGLHTPAQGMQAVTPRGAMGGAGVSVQQMQVVQQEGTMCVQGVQGSSPMPQALLQGGHQGGGVNAQGEVVSQGALMQGGSPQGVLVQQGVSPQGTVMQGSLQGAVVQQGAFPQGALVQQGVQGAVQGLSQGTMQQGELPQGAVMQGGLPQQVQMQGAMVQGVFPPGAVQQGGVPQSPQGVMQGGVYPQCAVVQGLPQGTMQEGTLPQGMILQGAVVQQVEGGLPQQQQGVMVQQGVFPQGAVMQQGGVPQSPGVMQPCYSQGMPMQYIQGAAAQGQGEMSEGDVAQLHQVQAMHAGMLPQMHAHAQGTPLQGTAAPQDATSYQAHMQGVPMPLQSEEGGTPGHMAQHAPPLLTMPMPMQEGGVVVMHGRGVAQHAAAGVGVVTQDVQGQVQGDQMYTAPAEAAAVGGSVGHPPLPRAPSMRGGSAKSRMSTASQPSVAPSPCVSKDEVDAPEDSVRHSQHNAQGQLLSLQEVPESVVGIPYQQSWWRERIVCAACGYSVQVGEESSQANAAPNFIPKWLQSLRNSEARKKASDVLFANDDIGNLSDCPDTPDEEKTEIEPALPLSVLAVEAPGSPLPGSPATPTPFTPRSPMQRAKNLAVFSMNGENFATLPNTSGEDMHKAGGNRHTTSEQVVASLNRHVEFIEHELRALSEVCTRGSTPVPFGIASHTSQSANIAAKAAGAKFSADSPRPSLDPELCLVVKGLHQCALLLNAEALFLCHNKRFGYSLGCASAVPPRVFLSSSDAKYKTLCDTREYSLLRDAVTRFQQMLKRDTIVSNMHAGVGYVLVTPSSLKESTDIPVAAPAPLPHPLPTSPELLPRAQSTETSAVSVEEVQEIPTPIMTHPPRRIAPLTVTVRKALIRPEERTDSPVWTAPSVPEKKDDTLAAYMEMLKSRATNKPQEHVATFNTLLPGIEKQSKKKRSALRAAFVKQKKQLAYTRAFGLLGGEREASGSDLSSDLLAPSVVGM